MDISIGSLLTIFNKSFTVWVVFPFLLGLGGYLTWKLKGLQFTKLKMAFSQLMGQKGEVLEEGTVSRYQSVATVIASGFGTGNISGMAVALATGGPGALFWMWVMAFLGSIVQFANTLCGFKYRQKNEQGEYVGGPMYYLKNGLGWKKIAGIFAVLVILVSFTAGDLVQVNSVALPLAKIGISPWITGLVMMFVVGLAVIGGSKRIASVAGVMVPLMALFYIGAATIVLSMFYDQIWPALSLVIKSAFGFGPAIGGALGYGVMQAIIFGFNRAIFATDAGTGVAPLLQSGASSKNPVIDGVATLVAPFMVMVVCTATFLVLLVTGAFQQTGLESTNMVVYGFSHALGSPGAYLVMVALFLFAYSSILGMAACMDRGVEYLFGDRFIKPFRYLFILMVPVGALMHVSMAWILADISLTLMLVINLAGTAGLAKQVIQEKNEYFAKSEVKAPNAELSQELSKD